MSDQLCPQCYLPKPQSAFKSTKASARCADCRAHYKLPTDQRPKRTWRHRTPEDEELRVRFVLKSQNQKVGEMPVSTSSPSTCPKACPWYANGCYAEHHVVGFRWRLVPLDGMSWKQFCAVIAALPPLTLWRHNEAGDLPGRDNRIDSKALDQLIQANVGRRGFTYTHKNGLLAESKAQEACDRGFTINMSLDSLAAVDELRARRPRLPLTVTVPSSEERTTFETPAGHRVTVCPAQTTDGITCTSCQLCALPQRRTVVAFRAHGQNAKLVDLRLSKGAA